MHKVCTEYHSMQIPLCSLHPYCIPIATIYRIRIFQKPATYPQQIGQKWNDHLFGQDELQYRKNPVQMVRTGPVDFRLKVFWMLSAKEISAMIWIVDVDSNPYTVKWSYYEFPSSASWVTHGLWCQSMVGGKLLWQQLTSIYWKCWYVFWSLPDFKCTFPIFLCILRWDYMALKEV